MTYLSETRHSMALHRNFWILVLSTVSVSWLLKLYVWPTMLPFLTRKFYANHVSLKQSNKALQLIYNFSPTDWKVALQVMRKGSPSNFAFKAGL